MRSWYDLCQILNPTRLFTKRFNVEIIDGNVAFVGDGVLDVPHIILSSSNNSTIICKWSGMITYFIIFEFV